MPSIRVGPLVVRALVGFVVAGVVAALALPYILSNGPVPLHVRWKAGISEAQRTSLERRYHLINGDPREGRTWAYQLSDTSTDNIRAMVQDPNVEDTSDMNRVKFRPRFSNDRQRRLIVFPIFAAVIGAIGAVYLSRNTIFTR
jgi:hypothetical protein